MSTLEQAIAIAAKAHEGQVDKAGAPYILHPLRVMLRLHTDEERIAGILHDVLEDTDVSIESLRAAGFSDRVLRALDSLTRRDGEAYDDFVRRAGGDAIARAVKIADLEDNADLRRIARPGPPDERRTAKYRRALAILGAGPVDRSDSSPGDSKGHTP